MGSPGGLGLVPTFTTNRLTGLVPSSSPAASIQVRRSSSLDPPSWRTLRLGGVVPHPRDVERALRTDPYLPGLSRRAAKGGSITGSPKLHLSVLLAGPGSSGGSDPLRRCWGCFDLCLRFQALAAPSFDDSLRRVQRRALSSRTVLWRLVAHDSVSPDVHVMLARQ